MRDDPRADALDALIDDTARALTAAAPPASLRVTVRGRMSTRPGGRRAPLWLPALGATLAGMIVLTLWPAPAGDVAPAEGTGRADMALPGERSFPDDDARAFSGGAASTQPQPLDRSARPAGSRNAVLRVQDAPAGAPAPESEVPLLTVAAVDVDVLRIAAVDVGMTAGPVPLEVEWLEIEPIAME